MDYYSRDMERGSMNYKLQCAEAGNYRYVLISTSSILFLWFYTMHKRTG